MKRFLTIALCALLVTTIALALASCGKSDTKTLEKKGYFVCGITVYDPMNYLSVSIPSSHRRSRRNSGWKSNFRSFSGRPSMQS